jgi:hypothetical protein
LPVAAGVGGRRKSSYFDLITHGRRFKSCPRNHKNSS